MFLLFLNLVCGTLSCLFVYPFLLAGLNPLGKKLLGFGVGLDEDVVFVKLEVMHCL